MIRSSPEHFGFVPGGPGQQSTCRFSEVSIDEGTVVSDSCVSDFSRPSTNDHGPGLLDQIVPGEKSLDGQSSHRPFVNEVEFTQFARSGGCQETSNEATRFPEGRSDQKTLPKTIDISCGGSLCFLFKGYYFALSPLFSFFLFFSQVSDSSHTL